MCLFRGSVVRVRFFSSPLVVCFWWVPGRVRPRSPFLVHSYKMNSISSTSGRAQVRSGLMPSPAPGYIACVVDPGEVAPRRSVIPAPQHPLSSHIVQDNYNFMQNLNLKKTSAAALVPHGLTSTRSSQMGWVNPARPAGMGGEILVLAKFDFAP